MTRDEHVQKILAFLFEEVGITPAPTNPFAQAVAHALFVLIDQAIRDGIRQARYEQAEVPSRN